MKIIKIIILQLFISSLALAAGFQSQEQSAAVFGAANAGTAVTRDISIVFFNPAGMTQFQHPAVSFSGIYLNDSFNYDPILATDFVGNPVSGSIDNPGGDAIIPAAYYIHPFNEKWFVGVALEVPYGLSTQYDQSSLARYFATKSELDAYTISPSVAYKINDKFSIGVALDIQYLTAEINQAYDFAAVSQFNQGDVYIQNKASDWNVGWNMGLYFQLTDTSRFGIAYRSPITHSLEGKSHVTNIPNDFVSTIIAQAFGLRDSEVAASLQLPESLTFSFLTDINPKWTVMADIQYTHWSSLKDITLTFFDNPTHLNPATNHLEPAHLVLDYHDTVRVALGQEIKVNKDILLRAGFAFDQTPARGATDLIRLPDGNRYWLTLGSSFSWKPNWLLDIAYAHIFIVDRTVAQSFDTGLGGPTVFAASYKNSEADLAGAQLTYLFG